jgi:prepilin-type N-terminal cleavage/methylation domain-containing protein
VIRASRARQDGFTLVELLVAVTILGIISVAIAASATVLFRSEDLAQTRLDNSRGPKLVGVYWTPDVNTSESVNPSGLACTTAGTALVTFEWNVPSDGSDESNVSTWATVPTSGGKTQLVRTECTSAALGTPVQTTVVAPNITASGTAVNCGSPPAACGSDATPPSVQLTLVTGDGRSFDIMATRKVG